MGRVSAEELRVLAIHGRQPLGKCECWQKVEAQKALARRKPCSMRAYVDAS